MEKKLSLHAAFIQVFGEGLAKSGFVRLKGQKHPHFVRLINDEILHIVTYRHMSVRKIGYETIEVMGGAASLYRRCLDFSWQPDSWLYGNLRFCHVWNIGVDNSVQKRIVEYHCKVREIDCDSYIARETLHGAFRYSIMKQLCGKDSRASMLSGMQNALDTTKHVMLPVLDRVTDLRSCIDYFYDVGGFLSGWLRLTELPAFLTDERYRASEGLLLVLANYRDDGTERMERKRQEEIAAGIQPYADVEEKYLSYDKARAEQFAIRERMLNEPELYAQVIAEAQRCKEHNLEMLRSYGVK